MNKVQKEIQEELRKAYHDSPKAPRHIKLPAALDVEMAEKGLRLRVDAKSVKANMQSDAAAVESWALVLRLWLTEKRVPHIVLDWDEPTEGTDGHYERFLYRVEQFRRLFPEWFEVADPQKLQRSRALSETSLRLNVASSRASQYEPKTTSREYKFESTLINSPDFRQHFALELVDRQFPVGLFAKTVSKTTRIFTGGKSAIDIVGVDKDNHFFIFELKAGNNFKVGILSELLLYTSLIREAAQMRIQFDTQKRNVGIGPDRVRKCSGINAVMLVENSHPLLEHPQLISTLNNAANDHWNHETGAKPVCFSKARVSEVGGKVLVRDFEGGC